VITCRGHDKVVTVRAAVADFDALATEHVRYVHDLSLYSSP